MGSPSAASTLPIEHCSIARTLEIIGEKWTLVVLREVFMGVRRFSDMRRDAQIPRQVLSDRLALLVEHGLLRRRPYQKPGQRERFEYALTRKGVDLHPALVALLAWGDKYAADPEGPALDLTHRDCGETVHLELHCTAGHGGFGPREIEPQVVAGARVAG